VPQIEASPAAHAQAFSDPGPLPVASSAVALIDNFGSPTLSFAVSLGSRGVPLHFYGSGAGRWSRYSSHRAACPPVEDADRFLPWLRRKIRSGEIQRVAPTTDLIAFYASMLREDFAPEVRRTIAPLIELERALIKTRFGAACTRIGQAVPDTEVPDDLSGGVAAAERLGFPLIMKPKSHLVVGDERGRLLNDMRELRAFYRPYDIAPGHESLAERFPELRWPLLQKYVPSARTRVFSISGYKDPDGGILAACLSYKRRQWPPDTGISTSQVSANDQRILARGLETLDKLVSRGIFELELIEAGTELLAIDLNPRAFGFIGLDIALGNDLPWLWYRSTLEPLTASVARNELAAAQRPIVECRLPIPYTISRCISALSGLRAPADIAADTAAATRTLPMLGHWNDPLPLLLATLWQLRHPGSLVRPYIRAAAAERRRNQMLAGRMR
jgi:D-aspartate ligase